MDYKEKVIALLKSQELSKEQKEKLENIFPELAESEDERIRRELIKVFSNREKYLIDQSFGDITVSEVLAWLEKVGSIIKEWGDLKVRYIHDDLQEMVDLKQKTEQGEQKPADEIGNYDHGKVLDSLMSAVIKTPEESLGIDSDTYNNIVDECIYGEQKPAWSEEDEEMLQNILECLRNGWRKLPTDILKYESWLKSLKDRVQPQNRWKPSDEQMRELDVVARGFASSNAEILESLYNELKRQTEED